MEHTQAIPTEGDRLDIDSYQFEILQVESHRILKVKITPISAPEYEV
jgi:CBS domain containing-hemolysin-like protein